MTMIEHKPGREWPEDQRPSTGERRRQRARYGNAMGIKELAEQLGTTHRALRYYEQVELISPARNASGARNYGPGTRRELELIVTLRRTGHSLKEIRAILSGDEVDDDGVRLKVAAALQSRLEQLQDQVGQTKALLRRFTESPRTAS
jgi:DNA-binding transcriptional MerR regulator